MQVVLYRARTCLANRLNGNLWIHPELYQKSGSYRARSAQATLAVNNNIVPGFQQSTETQSCVRPQIFKTVGLVCLRLGLAVGTTQYLTLKLCREFDEEKHGVIEARYPA